MLTNFTCYLIFLYPTQCQVFPNELESQDDYEGFTEWLNTFELFRGKKSEDEINNDNRVVGKFKVT